eukprot:6206788-Pleurochrysis_carterae.AAC.1
MGAVFIRNSNVDGRRPRLDAVQYARAAEAHKKRMNNVTKAPVTQCPISFTANQAVAADSTTTYHKLASNGQTHTADWKSLLTNRRVTSVDLSLASPTMAYYSAVKASSRVSLRKITTLLDD